MHNKSLQLKCGERKPQTQQDFPPKKLLASRVFNKQKQEKVYFFHFGSNFLSRFAGNENQQTEIGDEKRMANRFFYSWCLLAGYWVSRNNQLYKRLRL